MITTVKRFWTWYERNYTLNVSIAAALFVLQLIHLYWLATHVIVFRLLGHSLFVPSPLLQWALILVDYTEIPAIILTSFVYLNELRQQFSWKPLCFLLFLNSQWLHIFWITDEFVLTQFTGGIFVGLPFWLAWAAIIIDYLELPVIYDTSKRFFAAIRGRQLTKALEVIRNK